jgi:hypothetical protein
MPHLNGVVFLIAALLGAALLTIALAKLFVRIGRVRQSGREIERRDELRKPLPRASPHW